MNQNLEILRKLNLKVQRVQSNGEVVIKCPLHEDNHPSLSININTGKFLCRAGCIKGHSIKELVLKLTGETIDDGNEVDWLHSFKHRLIFRNAGGDYKLPSIPVLPGAVNNEGWNYLESRGFTYKTVIEWDLQYWQEERAIVIPIHKIGYILRYIDRKEYKYIPGTRVSETLFGINRVQLGQYDLVILVEGAFDTIYMHQLGFKNTLGILGSNLSEKQHKLLQGVCKQIYLLFDNDIGGSKAAINIGKVLKRDFIVKICQLPVGKDPNESTKLEIENSLNNAERL